ncbi:MAG: PAS domain S-box protein [Bacteroidetes bacterium]|nr:PAS domain S-box protein [Bacteroidota bacterium]
MTINLIYNFSVLVALSALSGMIDQLAHRRTLAGKLLQGLLFGGSAIVGMLYPMPITEGIFFDGRSVVISLAALFFGPITGGLSTLLAGLYRLHVGGPGIWMGLSVILSSFLIGWGFHQLRKTGKIKALRYRHLLLLGFVVHLVMIALTILLPSPFYFETLQKVVWLILIAYPLVTLVMGTILHDQEQNRKLFEDLSKSEKYLSTVFERIGDALISLNSQGKIVGINQSAAQLLGVKPEQAKGKHIDELIGLNGHEGTIQALFPVNEAYVPIPPVRITIHPHLETIPVSGTISAITDSDHTHRGWVLSLRDLRREQEYETRIKALDDSYKGLFNSIQSAVYIQNEKGEFLDVNQAAAALYGYPYEKFIGNTPEFLAAPGMNDLTELAHHIKTAFEGKAVQFEFWGRKATGEIFPKEVFLFPTNYFGKQAIVTIANDISERKAAEESLRNSESRYKYLFDSSPVGMLVLDLSGTIMSVNRTFCEDYGYEVVELAGKHIGMLAHPENKDLVNKNISEIIRQGNLVSKIKARTKNGQEIYLELNESLINLPDGRKGILSISKNITAETLADRAKQASEKRTSAILKALPDMIFVISNDGIFAEFHSSSHDQLLMPPQMFLNKSVDDVLPPYLATLTREKLAQVRQTGQVAEYEYDLFVDGKIRNYDARMVPVDETNVLVVVRDVTDKKSSQKAIMQQTAFIETLLDSIPNPLFYMNKESVYLGVNKAFTEFFGIDRMEIVGKSMFAWDDFDVAMRNREDDLLIYEGKEKAQQHERTITLRDGSQRNVILSKSAFHTPEGEVAGLIGLIIDITERKKNELDLIIAKEKAEESDRLKTSFLHNLNHEIRTPLNAILGFSDLLFDDIPDDQKREFVEIINSNAEQLLRIIDDVLIVSRMDAERLTVDKVTFDLGQLLHDLQLTFANACADKNLSFKIENGASSRTMIETDKAKLRQVISGLLDNAAKYTLKGGITISYDVDGDDLNIHVHDTGIGIEPEDQHRIFDRFYRGNKPQKMAIRGNGLGLSIAQGLVRLLGGSLSVASEPGIGSTFSLHLPGVVRTSEILPADQPGSLSQPVAGKKYRFLVAEDEDDNFDYLRRLLGQSALAVDRARTGADALQMVDRTAYDMVLMDLKMPEMDGLEATKRIREKYPALPVVVQTAYSQPDEIRQAIAAGATDVIVKPISREVFYEVLHRLLG